MNYLWQEFNIKTFPSETIVFRDGVFIPQLSSVTNHLSDNIINIDKNYDLPVHIIYIGEIAGKNDVNINIRSQNQLIFLTVKIINKNPAFLNIFIKNTGKNSKFNCNIVAQNYSDLDLNVNTGHFDENTGIFIKTHVLAHGNSKTKLFGKTVINKNCPNCDADIGFIVLAAPDAKIEFSPSQFISTPPLSAEHSANIYHPTNPQIEYLRTAGLSATEIKTVLEESFING